MGLRSYGPNNHLQGGSYAVPSSSITAADRARLASKRPEMHLGSSSFEREVGYVRGLEFPLLERCETEADVAALSTVRHRALLERPEGMDKLEASRRLETLLVELITVVRSEQVS